MSKLKVTKEYKQITVATKNEEEYLVLDSPVNWTQSTPIPTYTSEISYNYFDTLKRLGRKHFFSLTSSGCTELVDSITIDWTVDIPESVEGTHIRYRIVSELPRLCSVIATDEQGNQHILTSQRRIDSAHNIEVDTTVPFYCKFLTAVVQHPIIHSIKCVLQSPVVRYVTVIRTFNTPFLRAKRTFLSATSLYTLIQLGVISDSAVSWISFTPVYQYYKVRKYVSIKRGKIYLLDPSSMGIYGEDDVKGYVSSCERFTAHRIKKCSFLRL